MADDPGWRPLTQPSVVLRPSCTRCSSPGGLPITGAAEWVRAGSRGVASVDVVYGGPVDEGRGVGMWDGRRARAGHRHLVVLVLRSSQICPPNNTGQHSRTGAGTRA